MTGDIVRAQPLEDRILEIEYENGEVRVVNITPFLKGSLFEPLKNKSFFRRVFVNEETGTITWPNGADLCPDVLYMHSVPVSFTQRTGRVNRDSSKTNRVQP